MLSEDAINPDHTMITNIIVRKPRGNFLEPESYANPMTCFATIINIVLATGPFTVPVAFNNCGILLGTVFIVFIMILAYITKEFLVESLGVANALEASTDPSSDNDVSQNNITSPLLGHNEELSTTNLDLSKVSSNEEYRLDLSTGLQANVVKKDYQNKIKISEKDSRLMENEKKVCELTQENNPLFNLNRIIEYGILGEVFWREPGKILVNLALCIYLYGSLSVNCVSASKSLSTGLAYIVTKEINGFDNDYFGPDYATIIVFMSITTFLSMRNIQKTKILQNTIMIARFITITLMLIGGLYYIGTNGSIKSDKVKIFSFDDFANMFGNTVFAFLMHHSIPGILCPLRPENKLKKVVILAYGVGAMLLLSVCITAMIAFGGLENDCKDGFPCKLQTLYNMNFLGLPGIGHIVNFYLLFNIASFPILAITLRNNLMRLFAPSKIPENPLESNRWTYLFVFFALGPVFGLSMGLKDNLKSLLSITGGICGVILMIIIPCIMVFTARKRTVSNFGKAKFIHKSKFSHKVFPATLFLIGLVCLVYELYLNIAK